MSKFVRIRPIWLLIIYIILDTLCVGMGMGVPIFCILFGFMAGWLAVKYITASDHNVAAVLRKTLIAGIIASAITFLGMLILWGPFTSYLFDPTKDLANTGIPMILFQPRASLIGWIVLMVLISPFLQLLTILFSAYLTLLNWMKSLAHTPKAV